MSKSESDGIGPNGQFQSAFAKIARGKAHIGALNTSVSRWLDSSRFHVDTRDDELVVEVETQQTASMRQWPLIAADAISNLRGALDHAVWEISILTVGPPPEPLPSRWRRIQFPVCASIEQWAEAISGKRDRLWALPSEVRFAIERAQPFHAARPDEEPLVWLHELNNSNKHRTLSILRRRLPSGCFQPLSPNLKLVQERPTVPLTGRADIAKVGLKAVYGPGDAGVPEPGDSMTAVLSATMNVEVVFSEPSLFRMQLGIVEALSRMASTVQAIVDDLRWAYQNPPLFGGASPSTKTVRRHR